MYLLFESLDNIYIGYLLSSLWHQKFKINLNYLTTGFST